VTGARPYLEPFLSERKLPRWDPQAEWPRVSQASIHEPNLARVRPFAFRPYSQAVVFGRSYSPRMLRTETATDYGSRA